MSGLRHRIVYGLLKVYRLTLSPIFILFGAAFLSRHGVWNSSWMAPPRFSRCRPGGSSGYDPAPLETKSAPFWAPWRYGDWSLTERQFPDQGPVMKRKDQ